MLVALLLSRAQRALLAVTAVCLMAIATLAALEALESMLVMAAGRVELTMPLAALVVLAQSTLSIGHRG
jgi:hypothetical protein